MKLIAMVMACTSLLTVCVAHAGKVGGYTHVNKTIPNVEGCYPDGTTTLWKKKLSQDTNEENDDVIYKYSRKSGSWVLPKNSDYHTVVEGFLGLINDAQSADDKKAVLMQMLWDQGCLVEEVNAWKSQRQKLGEEFKPCDADDIESYLIFGARPELLGVFKKETMTFKARIIQDTANSFRIEWDLRDSQTLKNESGASKYRVIMREYGGKVFRLTCARY